MKKESFICALFILGMNFVYGSAIAETKKGSTKSVNNKHYGTEIKEIEINSVNFIKLPEAAGEVFISNPDIADIDMLSESSIYLTGLAAGTTTLVVHNKHGNIIADYQIKVTYPLKAIREAVSEMHSDADVDIVSVDNSIILKGRVSSPEVAADIQDVVSRFVDSAKIINKLSIETATQVMLKVKIAEVSRNLTKSLGINWRALSHSKDVTGMQYGFMSGDASAFPAFTKDTAEISTKMAESNGVLGKTLSGGRWVMHLGGNNGLSSLIEALASESFASILAEPTLVALSGEKATFRSGGEEGYEVKQTGTDSSTTEFKQWGTAVEFTPTVITEGRISIKVKPTVSTVTYENSTKGIPSLTTKEAETTVELGSGQSLAIAGLLQTTKNTNVSETPFLADLPLIGTLFRNSNIKTVEKELIIIVTPYIVKPSSKVLKAPTDMVPRMYSPLETILTRKFHKNVRKTNSAGFSIM